MLPPDEIERLCGGMYSAPPAEVHPNFMLVEGFNAVVCALAQVCERLDKLIELERGVRPEKS